MSTIRISRLREVLDHFKNYQHSRSAYSHRMGVPRSWQSPDNSTDNFIVVQQGRVSVETMTDDICGALPEALQDEEYPLKKGKPFSVKVYHSCDGCCTEPKEKQITFICL